MESKSLNKYISETGYCSRREADQLISDGRVVLNGTIANTGNRFVPGDIVEVDGSIIKEAKKEKLVYIALNKPVGITTTTELQVKDNIISFINYPKRIFPVGRLDKDSEGLIFLTNDGDIVNKILRASYNHEKEYIVRVNKPCTPDFIRGMAAGVPILDTVTKPCKVAPLGRQTFKIILTQGLNRQIRRMTEHFGYKVTMLQRVRILHVKLDKLAIGKWRYLNEAEMEELKYLVEVEEPEVPQKKMGAAVAKSRGLTGNKPGKDGMPGEQLDKSLQQRKSGGRTGKSSAKASQLERVAEFRSRAGKVGAKVSQQIRAAEFGSRAGKAGAKADKDGKTLKAAGKPVKEGKFSEKPAGKARKDTKAGAQHTQGATYPAKKNTGKAGAAAKKAGKSTKLPEKTFKDQQVAIGNAKGKQQKSNTSRSGGAAAKQAKSSSYKDFKNNAKVKAKPKRRA